MIEYTVTGRAMTLSEECSRACGHLEGIDGGQTDGSAAYRARQEVMRDAEILATKLGKSVEIYAHHPSCQDWVVAVAEPSTDRA